MNGPQEDIPELSDSVPVDAVKEKQALLCRLMELTNPVSSADYLSLLSMGLRCFLLSQDEYVFFSGMGIFEKIGFDIMAISLRQRLLEKLEKDPDLAADSDSSVQHA